MDKITIQPVRVLTVTYLHLVSHHVSISRAMYHDISSDLVFKGLVSGKNSAKLNQSDEARTTGGVTNAC